MWFWYGIISSFINTVVIVLSKRALSRVSSIVFTWALFTLALPLMIVWTLMTVSSVDVMFWVGVCGSAIVFVVGKLMQHVSMKQGTVSQIIPLSAFAIVFSYIPGVIFLSESVTFISLIGLSIIAVGVYILNIAASKEHFLEPFRVLIKDRQSRIYIFAMLLGSITMLFDKTALVHTYPSNPVMTLMTENILMIIPLTFIMVKRHPTWKKQICDAKKILMLTSILYTLASIFVYKGFLDGPVVLTVGITQLRILFALGIVWVFLSDKPRKSI